MAMIDPPIDKLIKKAPCRYALVCGVAKRARELESDANRDYLEASGKKSIQLAAEEVYTDKIIVEVGEKK
ncbi:MAG: DNA-directed RNA polymerase subunit omega [Clostridia bacterium]|nr:DNA-directed RNA polymerase subunit omega [Clostridia bacterium]